MLQHMAVVGVSFGDCALLPLWHSAPRDVPGVDVGEDLRNGPDSMCLIR